MSTSPFVSATVSTLNTGKMIFVSDFEGCVKRSANIKGKMGNAQSSVVCSQDFFNNLDSFLDNSQKLNKVAFLGDYFDRGIHFEIVIDNIIRLYKKHNGTSINLKPKKVYIILGNRDLNKLRLRYEYLRRDDIISSSTDAKKELAKISLPSNTSNTTKQRVINKFIEQTGYYPAWYSIFPYYPNYFNGFTNDNNKRQLLTHILSKSMTAPPDIQGSNSSIFLTYFENATGNYTSNSASNSASNSRIKQKTNFDLLFNLGSIVEYDPDYKVLLSHAGGMDSFVLHKESYYTKILDKINSVNDYFEKIEIARQELMKEPIQNDRFTNVDINRNEMIRVLNLPLREFIKKPENNSINIKKINPYFFLLQALGLKADDGRNYASFVESCDHFTCKGPRVNSNNKPAFNIVGNKLNERATSHSKYIQFLNKLNKLGIKIVSAGHRPHCAPVPLIYKRTKSPIVFIANDVSNGYRPANMNTVNKVPLSFAEIKDGNVIYVGVGMIDSLTGQLININPKTNLVPLLQPFKAMIQKWELDNVPVFSDTQNAYINYKNNNQSKLTFPARKNRNLLFTPNFSPAKMVSSSAKMVSSPAKMVSSPAKMVNSTTTNS